MTKKYKRMQHIGRQFGRALLLIAVLGVGGTFSGPETVNAAASVDVESCNVSGTFELNGTVYVTGYFSWQGAKYNEVAGGEVVIKTTSPSGSTRTIKSKNLSRLTLDDTGSSTNGVPDQKKSTSLSGSFTANQRGEWTVTCEIEITNLNFTSANDSRDRNVDIAEPEGEDPVCEINSFRASPSSVSYGNSSTLLWSTSNCTSARISGGVYGGGFSVSPSSGGANTSDLTGNTTFCFDASGPNGRDRDCTTVSVSAAPPPAGCSSPTTRTLSCGSGYTGSITQSKSSYPSCSWTTTSDTCEPVEPVEEEACDLSSLRASPSTVAYGGSSTLSWSTENCSNAKIYYGRFGSSGTNVSSSDRSHSENTGALYSNVRYCVRAGEPNTSSCRTVYVEPAPPGCAINNFYVSPTSVMAGSPTTLYWNTANCTSTTVSGGQYGGGVGVSPVASGSVTTGALSQTTTYTISAANSTSNATRSATVSVTPAPVFNYSLSNGGNVSIMKGGVNTYGQNAVTKTLTSGPAQAVNLSLSGVPSGVSYAIANGACSPSCVSTINFTVAPSTLPGTYPITVTGSPLSRTTTFSLTVNASPNIVATCTPSVATPILGETMTWTSSVSGGVPPYTYRWSGSSIPTSPAPSTPSFGIAYSTIGTKTAVITVTDSLSNVGSCTPVGTVEVEFDPNFEEI